MLKFIGLFFLLLSLSWPVVSSTPTKIYVWRNEKGVLVYSDSPKPGAEEIKVKVKNNIGPSVNASPLDINPQKKQESFQIEITQPEDKATIRDNTGSVYIRGLIKPRFKRGLKVQLYLNDVPHEEPSTQSIFVLRNVDRGEHQLKMVILDEKGKVIALSKAITFYMHRASVN